MVSDMSGQEPPSQAESHKWVCHILKNIHDTCFTPNFQEKSTGNDLRFVRGPQVMPIDVNNVNQAESSTCGTWPGWRCQRGWAWLGGPLTYLGHSQSISLEKLDIKHVLCLFLKIWRTHLWYLAWLTLSPSMSLTWRPLTYLRLFSIAWWPVFKIEKKTYKTGQS